jgi:hypothetical protein
MLYTNMQLQGYNNALTWTYYTLQTEHNKIKAEQYTGP